MKRKICLFTGALLASATILSACGTGFNQNDYNYLNDLYESVSTELDAITQEKESYKNEIGILESTLSEVQSEYDDYKKSISEQKTEPQTEAKIETEAKTETQAKDQGEASLEEQNALQTAKDYLDFTSFSRQGLIEQLEYEGYSTEASTYAADNCGADWNEQAAKTAQNYLDYSSFSRQGLLDQLIYEGFTQEQAEYGLSAVGY